MMYQASLLSTPQARQLLWGQRNDTANSSSCRPSLTWLLLRRPCVPHTHILPLAAGAVVVLLPVKQSADFVQHWLADTLLQQHVQGVLVDDSGG